MPKMTHKILLTIPAEVAEATNNTNEVLDGWSFRAMRDTLGTQIATAQAGRDLPGAWASS